MGVEVVGKPVVISADQFSDDTVFVTPDELVWGEEMDEEKRYELLVDVFDHCAGLEYEAMMKGREVSEDDKIAKLCWWEVFISLAEAGVHFGYSKMSRNELVSLDDKKHDVVEKPTGNAKPGDCYRVVRSGCVMVTTEERVDEKSQEKREVEVVKVLVKAKVEPYGWGVKWY